MVAESQLIGRFEHMVKRPRAEEAAHLLQKIASLVKPIMKARGFKVGTLAEMIPESPGLLGLNVNHGQKILIRLRPQSRLDSFYDLEHLVGTMLHELTHNVHGPHDAKFYKLLSELESEFDDLARKGYTGDGFFSNGARLGGERGLPQHLGKIKGLEAAEKRRQKQILIGRGGKLGGGIGGSNNAGKSMREILADAADRRIKDDKSCIHTDHGSAEEEARKAAAESEGVNAVDLPPSSSPSPEVEAEAGAEAGPSTTSSNGYGTRDKPLELSDDEEGDLGGSMVVDPPALVDTATVSKDTKPKLSSNPSKASSSRLVPSSKPSSSSIVAPPTKKPKLGASRLASTPSTSTSTSTPKSNPNLHPDGTWTCPVCTLVNEATARSCDACTGPKPRDESKGWWCEVCFDFGNSHDRWMCQSCGSIKKSG